MIKTQIQPRSNTVKRLLVTTGLLALARGLQSCSHFEAAVQHEVKPWPEGYSFCLRVLPCGPAFRMVKTKGVLIRSTCAATASDLTVELKNLETAWQMVTAQAGIHHVYAHHGIAVAGDIDRSMALIRMIEAVQSYLFPRFMSRKIIKRVPPMNWQRQRNRLRLLGYGMLAGK